MPFRFSGAHEDGREGAVTDNLPRGPSQPAPRENSFANLEKVVLHDRETNYDTGDRGSAPERWESVIDAWILAAAHAPRGHRRLDGGLTVNERV